MILKERRSWRKATAQAEKKWGVPIGYQMAVIKYESGFDGRSRTPRKRSFFGLIPGKRISSARGYAQALSTTWEHYVRDSGNRGAQRSNFGDATDFIGWYSEQTRKRTGLEMSAYRDHYLAYHEGAGGYLKGSWRSKDWLITKASKLDREARTFSEQVKNCRFKRFLFF